MHFKLSERKYDLTNSLIISANELNLENYEGQNIQSARYKSRMDQLLEIHRYREISQQIQPNDISLSIILGIHQLLDKKDEFWKNLGLTIAGPVVYSFTKFIHEQMKPHDEVVFIARDGYSLQKAFQLLFSQKTHYMYCPRIFKNQNLDLFKSYISHVNPKNFIAVDSVTISYTAQTIFQNSLNRKVKFVYWATWVDKSEFDYVKFSGSTTNNWGFMEFITSSPELPIVTLDSKFNPVHRTPAHPKEIYKTEVYEKMFSGTIEYVQRVKEVFGKFLPSMSGAALTQFMNVFFKTNQAEMPELSTLCVASDADHLVYEPLFKQKNKKQC